MKKSIEKNSGSTPCGLNEGSPFTVDRIRYKVSARAVPEGGGVLRQKI